MTLDKVKLGSVAKVLNGYAFKSREYVENGIRIVRITNVQKGRIQDDDPKFIDIHRSDEFARFMLDDGDILISLTGNVGRVGVIEESMLPAALNQRVGALKIKSENVEPEYLFHVLNSENFEQDAIKNSKGIAQLNLSSKWIEEYEIPLPPLTEQKRIAGILDAADALRARRREALAQLDTLLQSIFFEMFGDPVTNSMEWKTGCYGDCIKNGPKNGISKTKEFLGRGVPLLDNKGLYRSMWADFSDLRLIDVSREELHKYRLSDGDVIVNRVSVKPEGVGLPVLVKEAPLDCVFESNMMRISPDISIIDPVFFVFCLRTDGMRKQTINAANLANQASINQTGLRSIKVILPPLNIQRRFAAIVESVEQQKAAQRAHLAELDTLFASLQSRAFRGDL